MMRVVLLAVCSANVVAFLQRPAIQADDATGAEHADADERPPSNDAPTSRSLMFATVPQNNDDCGGGELLVRHHDDHSCSCESPQDGCMLEKDCYADQSCSEEGGSGCPAPSDAASISTHEHVAAASRAKSSPHAPAAAARRSAPAAQPKSTAGWAARCSARSRSRCTMFLSLNYSE